MWGLSRKYPAMCYEKKTFTEKATRTIVHRTMAPQSPSKEAPWDLTQFSPLPSPAPSHFPESHWWSEISFLSKVILVLENPEVPGCQIWAVRGAESPGWFDVFAKKPCTTHDAWTGTLSWWSCQSPVAQSCSLLNHPNSFCNLLQNLMQIHCSTCTVILNVTATQYTRSLNGIYCPH